jgi:hypothetical protein
MAFNWIRGFRRIGWVVTILLASLVIVAFDENTKDFSSTDYKVSEHLDTYIPDDHTAFEMADGGYGYFPSKVPSDVAKQILSKFPAKVKLASQTEKPLDKETKEIRALAQQIANHPKFKTLTSYEQETIRSVSAGESIYEVDTENGKYLVTTEPNPHNFVFIVHKQTNKLKLSAFILGSLTCVTVLIQGSISILAWVLRGFSRTSQIDVS